MGKHDISTNSTQAFKIVNCRLIFYIGLKILVDSKDLVILFLGYSSQYDNMLKAKRAVK
jgi:hypothetical protein